jgi:uncharacterized secreted protein with C-terminal beta-propeller domain
MSLACSCGYSGSSAWVYPPFWDQGDFKVVQSSLQEISGCDDLLAALKQSAIAEMRLKVLAELDQALEYDSYGDCDWDYYGSDGGYADGSSGADAGGSTSPPPDEEADEYSTTNVQELGVDEADFLKNDGKYIYILAGGEFTVVQAWPAPDTRILSSYPIEGDPQLLFVHNDRAVIYSNLSTGLKITVLNITDVLVPVLEREVRFSGSYMSSRRIGNAVYTVIEYPEVLFPPLQYRPDSLERCGGHSELEIKWAFYHLIQENEDVINRSNPTDWLPSAQDKKYSPNGLLEEDKDLFTECGNFYAPAILNGRGFLTIASLDILNLDGPVHLSSIVGQQGVVYASSDALYVVSPYLYNDQGSWFFPDPDKIGEAITIHKFSLCHSPAESYYEASGIVEGRPLNQFSMGEHEGHLRIATTTGRVWNSTTYNSVFVLEQNQSLLDVIGRITGIAPTEDIRAVRFVGDRGFVVTFKKTDPLYAIDLSDPRNPRIAGELKIPGFSTYIHMLDHDHLLTIGFDGDDQGPFAWFQGVVLQIFDISDMGNPLLTHKEIIGTRGSTSEATGNHLAFNYFPPKDVLALPMVICEDSSGDGSYGTLMTFNGLLVYNVTLADGFSERGRVSHGDSSGDSYSCSNWWTNPDSRVKRSIIMDDFVYSISSTLLKVNHLDNLESDVAVVDLPPIP